MLIGLFFYLAIHVVGITAIYLAIKMEKYI